MKPYAAVLLGMMLAVVSSAQSTLDLVQQASQATGADYIAARNRIVTQGDAVVPALQAILAAKERPWPERVVAGICAERIQKGAAIQEILQKDWRHDPTVKDLPGWKSRLPYPRELDLLICKQVEDANVPYFCLELVWKQTGEHNPITRDVWEAMGAAIAVDRGDPFVADILVGRMRADMDLRHSEIDSYYMDLIKIGRNQDLPLLLDAWLQSTKRELDRYPAAAAQFHKEFPNVSFPPPVGGLEKLIPLAKPEDADWIIEKLKGIPLDGLSRAALENYLRRCGRLSGGSEVSLPKPVEGTNSSKTSALPPVVNPVAVKTETVKPVLTEPTVSSSGNESPVVVATSSGHSWRIVFSVAVLILTVGGWLTYWWLHRAKP
jgi:hypothetical protein